MRIIPTTAASGSRNRLVPLNAEENPRSTGWDEALERGFCAAPGRDAAVYGVVRLAGCECCEVGRGHECVTLCGGVWW